MIPERLAMSVSELNEYVRLKLATDPMLRLVEVTGEISGFRKHISGHRYFSLKDDSARVQCVMFRQQAYTLDFEPKDGMRVTVKANVSLFVRDGSYQLYVESIKSEGVGQMFMRFEALKRKLLAEGLFDPSRKRQIPFNPKVIGVATSKSGAAFHDIVRVATRRNPNIGIILAPCAVQGDTAASEIIRAINRLNENGKSDVLLVGRGGGSAEDLFPFNDEALARTIAASKIPVISCVGHEIDFTIADFVADVRAATPSMAAELAVPVIEDLLYGICDMEKRLIRQTNVAQELRRANLNRLTMSKALSRPDVIISMRKERLNNLALRLGANEEAKQRLRRERLVNVSAKLISSMDLRLKLSFSKLDGVSRALNAIDPKSVFDRGYAIIRRKKEYIANADELSANDKIEIDMKGGSVPALVIGGKHAGKTDV